MKNDYFEKEEWYTPKDLVNTLLESGKVVFEQDCFLFDLDPASSRDDNITPLSKSIFTREDNGLEKSWFGYIFLNPPFTRSRKIEDDVLQQFIKKAVDHNDGIVLCLDKPNVQVTGLLRENCSCIVTFKRKLRYTCNSKLTKAGNMPQYFSIMYGLGDKAALHLKKFVELYNQQDSEMGPEYFIHVK